MTLHNDDFARLMPQVAEHLLGEPNRRMSSKSELRWGTKGSLSVDVKKGVFVDHSMAPGEKGAGGGTLDFIERETGKKGKDRVDWLMDNGFLPDDRMGGPSRSFLAAPPADNGHDEAPPWDQGEPDQGGSAGPATGPAGVPLDYHEVASFDYLDAAGKLTLQVVRFEPNDRGAGRGKTFRQRRPLQGGAMVWNTKDVVPVPYRLPELIADIKDGATIFVVEGEKCVDALRDQGVPATTNAGGAGHWSEDHVKWFAGAKVVILSDNDPQAINKKTGKPRFHEDGRPVYAGRDHAVTVAKSLQGIAASAVILELGGRAEPPLAGPDLPPKGDVVEWLGLGNSTEALYALADKRGVVWSPDFDWRSRFHAIPWHDMDRPAAEHEWLVKGWLTRYERAMLVGPSKSGKSFLALDIAFAVARGTDFFGHKVRRGLVLYQAGEGRLGLKKRVRAYRSHNGLKPEDDVPFVLLPTRIDLYGSDDHTNALIEEAAHWQRVYAAHRLELFIVDTYSAATPGANENASEDVSKILARADRLSEAIGAAVLIVHHKNAAGSRPRGHSSVFANLDSVIDCELEEGLKDAGEPYQDNITGETRYRRRPIRVAELTKQKDEEDGERLRFVLKSVQVGVDADGDPVTSCVVITPYTGAMGDADKVSKDYGKKLTAGENMLLKAVYFALENHGVPAPPTLQLAAFVMVVDWKHVRAQYATLTFEEAADGEDPKKVEGRIKMAIKRAGEVLVAENVIMRERPYVWLTGRRVKGFAPPRTDKPKLAVVGGTDTAAPPAPTAGTDKEDAPF
jgi:hypothetical protein